MELAQFLKPVKPASVSAEPASGAVTEVDTPGSAVSGEQRTGLQPDPPGSPATSATDTEGVATAKPIVYRDTTPSGLVVEYSPGDGTKENPRWYKVNGVEVPSVTTVLDVLRKDGLAHWGCKVGVEGIIALFDRDKMGTVVDWSKDAMHRLVVGSFPLEGNEPTATVDNVMSLLKEEKLTPYYALNRAGDRGTNVHSALEAWASSGCEFAPTPQNFPDEERPYVEGLLKFIDDCDGAVVPLAHEVMVGSAEHGFAGRFDLIVEITDKRQFVRKQYKRKDSVLWTPKPGRWRLDLKTSSGVYDSHHLQLAGYEGASIEGGYQPCRGGAILRVDKEGYYELVPSEATFDQFLAVKSAYDALKGLKA